MEDLIYVFPLFGMLAMAAVFAQTGNEANYYPPIVYLEFDEAVAILLQSDLNGIRQNRDDWDLDDYTNRRGGHHTITDEVAQRLIDEGMVDVPDDNWSSYHYTAFVEEDA